MMPSPCSIHSLSSILLLCIIPARSEELLMSFPTGCLVVTLESPGLILCSQQDGIWKPCEDLTCQAMRTAGFFSSRRSTRSWNSAEAPVQARVCISRSEYHHMESYHAALPMLHSCSCCSCCSSPGLQDQDACTASYPNLFCRLMHLADASPFLSLQKDLRRHY